jgi:hypothetical protein
VTPLWGLLTPYFCAILFFQKSHPSAEMSE